MCKGGARGRGRGEGGRGGSGFENSAKKPPSLSGKKKEHVGKNVFCGPESALSSSSSSDELADLARSFSPLQSCERYALAACCVGRSDFFLCVFVFVFLVGFCFFWEDMEIETENETETDAAGAGVRGVGVEKRWVVEMVRS